MCEFCGEKVSVCKCQECDAFYCEDCYAEAHIGEDNNHMRVPVSSYNSFPLAAGAVAAEVAAQSPPPPPPPPIPISVPVPVQLPVSPQPITIAEAEAEAAEAAAIITSEYPYSNDSGWNENSRYKRSEEEMDAYDEDRSDAAEAKKKKHIQQHQQQSKEKAQAIEDMATGATLEEVTRDITRAKRFISKLIDEAKEDKEKSRRSIDARADEYRKILSICVMRIKQQEDERAAKRIGALQKRLTSITQLEEKARACAGGVLPSDLRTRAEKAISDAKATAEKPSARWHFSFDGRELTETFCSKVVANAGAFAPITVVASVPMSDGAIKYQGAWRSGPRYRVEEEGRAAVCTSECRWDTVVLGDVALENSSTTWWAVNLRQVKSPYGVYVGVAPASISPRMCEAQTKCGWYIASIGLYLWSGDPHYDRGTSCTAPQNIREGSVVRMKMDTKNGILTFQVESSNGFTKGWVTAYKGIPCYEPLVPVVLLSNMGDTVVMM